MDYSSKSLVELKAICKEKGIKGFSTKKKDELIELLKSADPVTVPAPVPAPVPAHVSSRQSPTNEICNTATATNDDSKFRPESLQLNSELDKEIRQAQGIYFTPKKQRHRLFEVLDTHGVNPKMILEPSFGSGEFIHDARAHWTDAQIVGVEYNQTIYSKFKAPLNCSAVCADFLTYTLPTQFDCIIGNPPYFVTNAKNPECMTGRGNIFVQFIHKCLKEHMTNDGILAFILPTSFYNCSYYDPCRNYMAKHATILHVENMDGGFYDTAQDTMLLVFQKRPPSQVPPPYFILHRGFSYITPHASTLQTLLSGSVTLTELGLSVKTGDVVWNQHKASLTNTGGEVIIYSSNIIENRLVLDNLKVGGEKKQRILGFTRPACVGPALCINRGYGNKFTLNYVRIPDGMTFYGENHVNVVTGPVESLNRLEKSLGDPRTSEFIRLFVGNGALSKTELETLLPVF